MAHSRFDRFYEEKKNIVIDSLRSFIPLINAINDIHLLSLETSPLSCKYLYTVDVLRFEYDLYFLFSL